MARAFVFLGKIPAAVEENHWLWKLNPNDLQHQQDISACCAHFLLCLFAVVLSLHLSARMLACLSICIFDCPPSGPKCIHVSQQAPRISPTCWCTHVVDHRKTFSSSHGGPHTHTHTQTSLTLLHQRRMLNHFQHQNNLYTVGSVSNLTRVGDPELRNQLFVGFFWSPNICIASFWLSNELAN